MNNGKEKSHDPKRHHFVPAFYLRGWARPEMKGKLIEYRNLGPHGVASKDVAAESTGFEWHLYSMTTSEMGVLDPSFEKTVMSRLDSDAANILPELLSGKSGLKKYSKRNWSSFLYAQLLRDPTEMEISAETRREMWKRSTSEQEEWYRNERSPEMPETFAEILAATPGYDHDKMFFEAFEAAIFNSPAVDFISSLRWNVRKLRSPKFPLLTADRPVYCNNRMGHSDGLIYMPLDPYTVFYALPRAAKSHEVLDRGSDNRVVHFCNKGMVEGASEYVWTNFEGHRSFVEKWIGSKNRPGIGSIVKKTFEEMPERVWEQFMTRRGRP